MTTNAMIGLKSRRAHSMPLDDSELSDIFDPIEFAQRFEELNPTLSAWDSERGLRE